MQEAIKVLKLKRSDKKLLEYDLAFHISQMIIEARIGKGWTQTKLAQKCGMLQESIARIEAGYNPTVTTLTRISKALKMPIEIKFKS